MTPSAAFWDGIAESYSKKPVEDPEAFEKKIAVTKEAMSPEDVVLDIGCGTGSLALRLAPHTAQVHGLDISPEMIRIARGKAAADDLDNVTFHVGPFDEHFTAFEPGSLDGICAYSILHLFEDRHAALKQVFTLLKPGGFFISSTACLGNSWVPYRLILWAMRKMGKAPHVDIMSTDALKADIREAGFVGLRQPDVGAESTVAFIAASKP